MLTEHEALAYVREAQRILAMTQSGYEARDFAMFIEERDISNILELGTCSGGMMWLMDKLCKPGLRISMDMPWSQRDPLPPPEWEEKFRQHLPHVTQIFGDIHAEAQLLKLAVALEGRKLDLIFIDADHQYAGGKKHFEMYSPFLRRNGYIAFHDTHNGWPVGKFYKEICGKYPHYEFIEKGNTFGIGVIQLC